MPGTAVEPRGAGSHAGRRAGLRLAGAALALAATGGAGWLLAASRGATWTTPLAAGRPVRPRDAPLRSVAVVPFAVDGESSDVGWLADALHGDLIAELARPKLDLVIARDTMATYKGKAVDSRTVARELGVRHVVRGTLRRQNDEVRISVALVDGESGAQVWAEAFVADRGTLRHTVDEFAAQIERVLQGEMLLASAARRPLLSADQVDADELVMRAYALWYRGFHRENVVAALAMVERAAALDPGSVRAWHYIAVLNLHAALNGWVDDRDAAFRRVDDASARLDRIDRDGVHADNVKTMQHYLRGDTAGMLRHTAAWTSRHPVAIAFGAHGFALLFNARFDDAVRAEERALRLSPRDAFRAEWQYRLALAHFAAGRHALARDWGQTAGSTNPGLRWPPVHAAASRLLGEADAARRMLAEHESRHGRFDPAQAGPRLPGSAPGWVEARDLLLTGLAALGDGR